MDKVLVELARWGLLLETDGVLPSLAAIVAGEPIRGSWWGHSRGADIFHVSTELAEHPDVLLAKLINGKLTWIHRALWPSLLAVARERAPWQMEDLSPAAARLLDQVDRDGSVRADQLAIAAAERKRAVAALDQKLLVHSTSVHTDSGAHAKLLASWTKVARERGIERPPTPAAGRTAIERAAHALASAHDVAIKLPWKQRR